MAHIRPGKIDCAFHVGFFSKSDAGARILFLFFIHLTTLIQPPETIRINKWRWTRWIYIHSNSYICYTHNTYVFYVRMGELNFVTFSHNTSLSSIRKTCLRKVISGDPWDFSCFQIRIRICTIMLNKKLVRSDYPSFPTNVHSEGSSEKWWREYK